ncbi:stage III sporulation protein AF [Oceanobacillus chungangensis]|uniref:Stage III sporulation protein AF n=1 Tax=Oceanobacillus chungangensis TaxID=1229152 RepID=A0A3D8Q2Y5_9BACI|nr:stage III sporulation protein AF [Oceanobacillus chungangensis]RDW21959.1 stage III sporulation protein AF [Oceanobacillus chungangensis]
MEILIDWVTQIILFIILATIIDLLIPATSMKKYIKLVIGLILILILLKPIFYLFNIDIEKAVESSIQSAINGEMKDDSLENLIKFQKNEIETTQDAYILEQMAVQLKELANDSLNKEFQLEITNIEFLFTSNQEKTYENLNEVIVHLSELENGEGAVNVVEDVVINTDNPVEIEERINEQEIIKMLEDIWELNDKEIILNWEGGSS